MLAVTSEALDEFGYRAGSRGARPGALSIAAF